MNAHGYHAQPRGGAPGPMDNGEARVITHFEKPKTEPICPLDIDVQRGVRLLESERNREEHSMAGIRRKMDQRGLTDATVLWTDSGDSERKAEAMRSANKDKRLFNDGRRQLPEYGEDRPVFAVVEPRRWTR